MAKTKKGVIMIGNSKVFEATSDEVQKAVQEVRQRVHKTDKAHEERRKDKGEDRK